MILRRSRGYAPSAVASIPTDRPILAVGADLKNSITLVVNGQAFVSQHIGDLAQYQSFRGVSRNHPRPDCRCTRSTGSDLIVAHDAHPQYLSTVHALELAGIDNPAPSSIIAPTSPRSWPSAAPGTSESWESALTEPATATMAPSGAVNCSQAASSKASNAWPICARRLSPAATLRHDIQSKPPPDFSTQIEDLPDLNAEPFLFPDRYRAIAEN